MPERNIVKSIQPAYEELTTALECNNLVCVTGPPATGKTTLVRMALDEVEDRFMYAYVDCYDVAIPSNLFTNICNQFHCKMNPNGKHGKLISSFQIKKQTVSVQDFPEYFREYSTLAKSKKYEKIFVVIDQIEQFRRTTLMDSIALLLTLRDLNIIWITNRSPTDIVMYISDYSPRMSLVAQDRTIPIYVPCWSRESLVEAILETPPRVGKSIYQQFVNNVVGIKYAKETRNFRELKQYCQDNFKTFLEAFKLKVTDRINSRLKSDEEEEVTIDDEDLDDIDVAKNFTSELIVSFLRTISRKIGTQRANLGERSAIGGGGGDELEDQQVLKSIVSTSTLLVAAYVAAHTRPTNDKRNFVRYQKRASRRGESNNKDLHDQTKLFTMERLIHIYLSLVRSGRGKLGEELDLIENNDYILSDLERLEALNILQIKGGDGISSDTRYKLSPSVRKTFIHRLARNVDIKLSDIDGLQ